MKEFLQVGDVFVAPSLAKVTRFEFSWNSETPKIDTKRLDVSYLKYAGETGPAFDPTRAMAEWLVTATEMSGGGTGHGAWDVYPDGWGVHATRLKLDGTYDPGGERIFFRQSGSFNNILEDVQKVREMVAEWRPKI